MFLLCNSYKQVIDQKSRLLLFASKHLTALEFKNNAGVFKTEEVKIDPKKIELLQRLGLEEATEGIKTGYEMRKDRKLEQKLKRDRERRIEKVEVPKKKASTEKIRFKLGCGIEALTAENLLGLVRSTAPYLFPDSKDVERLIIETDEEESDQLVVPASELTLSHQRLYHLSAGPLGWKSVLTTCNKNILRATETPTIEERIDYFALCMASHFATVATYVPTDVDSKIRGHCWNDPNPEVLYAQIEILKNALEWEIDDEVSKKALTLRDYEPDKSISISGHNGEWLGVLCGAWGSFLRLNDIKTANELEAMIYNELDREAKVFQLYREMKSSTESDTILLKIAAIITHNVGDVDQGLSYWDENIQLQYAQKLTLFSKLAHERGDRFNGEFLQAKNIYKELLSAEGHRNYPLREAKCLRRSPDFMLPLGREYYSYKVLYRVFYLTYFYPNIGPWYEKWGRLVAIHPGLSQEDRALVIKQLLRACDSTSKAWCVPNQVGYYRALQGIASCMSIEKMSLDLDKECRVVLKDHTARLHLSLSEEAYASKLGKRAREILDM
jgi:hypothetical protein